MAWTITSLLELSKTVENKGELIDCLMKHDCRKPGSYSLPAVSHGRHTTKHGNYGGYGR
jgi:hypothetical protein